MKQSVQFNCTGFYLSRRCEICDESMEIFSSVPSTEILHRRIIKIENRKNRRGNHEHERCSTTMILGIGCDLLKVSRIERIVRRQGLNGKTLDRFATRILHPVEREQFVALRRSDDIAGTVRLLSGSWCCKEAVFKSLDPGRQAKFRFNRWYKSNDEYGRPTICGDDVNNTDRFLVSVSHDGDMIMSTVLRQGIQQ